MNASKARVELEDIGEGHVTIYNTIRDRNIPESYTAEEVGLP